MPETKLKKIIEARELSYRVVAKMSGVSASSVYDYAIGKRRPTLDNAIAITKSLKLDENAIYYLFETN